MQQPRGVRALAAVLAACLQAATTHGQASWGGSGPPVMLLGCYTSAHQYDEFAPKLASGFRVYAMTRRGIDPSALTDKTT